MEALALAASIVTLCGPIVKAVLSWYRHRQPEPVEIPDPTPQDFLLSWPEEGSDAEHYMLIEADINRRRSY